MTEWNVIKLDDNERNMAIALVNLYSRSVKVQEKTLALEEKKWELYMKDRKATEGKVHVSEEGGE